MDIPFTQGGMVMSDSAALVPVFMCSDNVGRVSEDVSEYIKPETEAHVHLLLVTIANLALQKTGHPIALTLIGKQTELLRQAVAEIAHANVLSHINGLLAKRDFPYRFSFRRGGYLQVPGDGGYHFGSLTDREAVTVWFSRHIGGQNAEWVEVITVSTKEELEELLSDHCAV
ncbi:hypothetical protein K2Q16_01895 [Patescibacteria group bacterium]|nr:hypothetical protein [Patescibacteria group bacterium]